MEALVNVPDVFAELELTLLRDYDQRLARMQDKLEDVKREMAEKNSLDRNRPNGASLRPGA